MWQLFELGALFTSASQDVVDKFAIVKHHSIDSVVVTFHRTACFLLAILAIGLFGVLGPVSFFFNWEVLVISVTPFLVAVAT